jgi:hypothetical protein
MFPVANPSSAAFFETHNVDDIAEEQMAKGVLKVPHYSLIGDGVCLRRS